jgi:hypothetical protein
MKNYFIIISLILITPVFGLSKNIPNKAKLIITKRFCNWVLFNKAYGSNMKNSEDPVWDQDSTTCPYMYVT